MWLLFYLMVVLQHAVMLKLWTVNRPLVVDKTTNRKSYGLNGAKISTNLNGRKFSEIHNLTNDCSYMWWTFICQIWKIYARISPHSGGNEANAASSSRKKMYTESWVEWTIRVMANQTIDVACVCLITVKPHIYVYVLRVSCCRRLQICRRLCTIFASWYRTICITYMGTNVTLDNDLFTFD